MEARRAPFVWAQSATRLRVANQPEEGRLQPGVQPDDGRARQGLRDRVGSSGWNDDRDDHPDYSRSAVTKPLMKLLFGQLDDLMADTTS